MCWFDFLINFVSRHKHMHSLARRRILEGGLFREQNSVGKHLPSSFVPALPGLQ